MRPRHRFRTIVACVIAAATFSALAIEQAVAANCGLTYYEARAVGLVAQDNDSTAKFIEFNGDDAKALAGLLYASQPEPDVKIDHVLVIERANSDFVKVALVANGCVFRFVNTSEQEWVKWRQAALGSITSDHRTTDGEL